MSTAVPAEALKWLATWPGVRALTLSGMELPRQLVTQGHDVFALTATAQQASELLAAGEVKPIHAQPEALPIDAYQFDVVFAHQSFHRFDAPAVLAETARVLRPGGCLSLSYTVRDDSVPWVRRLAALLRRYDPLAMQGDYGADSLAAVRAAPQFPEVEERAFRIWTPCTLEQLRSLVQSQPLMQHLDQQQQEAVLREVTELYQASGRPGEPLRLPFLVMCLRAFVHHNEPSQVTGVMDYGLDIPMSVSKP